MTILFDWKTEFRCVACKHPLGSDVRFMNHGLCGHCGWKDKSAYTIVATTEHAYREVREGPWWAIWVPLKREYMTDGSD